MSNDVSAGLSLPPRAETDNIVIDQQTTQNDSLEQEAYDHVLKLLSFSVNASLSELGHFPGSGTLLQELRNQNKQFQDVSRKLHEDNVTLQRVINKQKQDISSLQNHNFGLAKQLESLGHECRQLNETLKKVIIERDNLVSYTQVMAQNPPVWVSHPFPHPPPYAMLPMQHVIPQPTPVPAPTIQGYNVERGPHLPGDMRNAQLAPSTLLRAPIIASQALPTAPRPPRHFPVIDLTESDDQPVEERERKRPRHSAPEEPPPTLPALATPTTPQVDLSQLGQQLLQIEQEVTPQAAPASASEQQPSSPSLPQAAETDEDYEEEERDADGLIPIEKCLETAYEEREGKLWCRMCDHRFQALKSTDQPLAPMPSNEQGDLVRHLQEVHPAGWVNLRNQ